MPTATFELLRELAIEDAKQTLAEEQIQHWVFDDLTVHYTQEPKLAWLTQHFALEGCKPTDRDFDCYRQEYVKRLKRAVRFLLARYNADSSIDELDDLMDLAASEIEK